MVQQNLALGHVFVLPRHRSASLETFSNMSGSFIVFLQYAPLSLRPLTCEVKGHRLGPREQSCIQFQRLRKEERDGVVEWSGVWSRASCSAF